MKRALLSALLTAVTLGATDKPGAAIVPPPEPPPPRPQPPMPRTVGNVRVPYPVTSYNSRAVREPAPILNEKQLAAQVKRDRRAEKLRRAAERGGIKRAVDGDGT